MQTSTTCMQCYAEDGIPDFSSDAVADIPESGVIEVTCCRGHRTATIIQQTKFELLSEMGVKAMANGSYRDAVSSFATSLERLYEFFIEAACRKHGISSDAFAAAWKPMAAQSERQLGAFLAVYLLDTRKLAKLLPRTQVEFRNAVVHKGRFPNREESIQFGQAIFDCAIPVVTLLRSAPYSKIVSDMTFESIDRRSKPARDAGLVISTQSIATPLSFAVAEQPVDLEMIVASYANRPDFGRAI